MNSGDLYSTTRIYLFIIYFFGILFSCQFENEKSTVEKPEDNRFTKIVLAENLNQPMQMDFLKDGRIIYVEREGGVKLFEPASGIIKTLAEIPVSGGYYDDDGTELSPVGEDGMQGVILDPDYENNRWLYLYYSPKEGNSGSVLARYTWEGDSVDLDSRVVLLEVPNQRKSCCHLGGGMVFDRDGNLYLSTGDNTPNDPRGFNPVDERPGRDRFDSQRSSSNTNDLRGKILRIHPEDDGTYSIPEGNLFLPGTPDTRPEIYTMGNRNPYRLSIDSETGWLFWGEVGPTGSKDVENFGPKSYDEFNMAKEAGNFGWPYLSGNNFAYWSYDYAKKEPRDQFDPSNLVNKSPNNTGLQNLPPPTPALIWYPQAVSEDFPIPGSGSASALGGPVFRESDFGKDANIFPSYYEGKWFITDWSRGWIMVVELDDFGNYMSMERFLPNEELIGPNDMMFGPDGDLYVLEYGRGPYIANSEARLIKFRYNSGNRAPVVKATVEKTAGAVPFEMSLSSQGTVDYDDDILEYEWEIKNIENGQIKKIEKSDTSIIINEQGIFEVVLYVDDGIHLVQSEPVEVSVGNEPPEIFINIPDRNTSFAFGEDEVKYEVDVWDKEDGRLSDGEIEAGGIKVNVDFLVGDISDVVDLNTILEKEDVLMPVRQAMGKNLIKNNDCSTCHRTDSKLMGPSFKEIRNKYEDKNDAERYLAEKIIDGSVGIWGEEAMPAHPLLTMKESRLIVDYILKMDQGLEISLPVTGHFKVNNKIDEDGRYILRASYEDQGFGEAPNLETVKVFELRSPRLYVTDADEIEGFIFNHHIGQRPTVSTKDASGFFKFSEIDLTEIGAIEIELNITELEVHEYPDFEVELHLNSPDGVMAGKTDGIIREESINNWTKFGIMRIDLEKNKIEGKHDIYFKFSSDDRSKREYEFIDVLFRKK